ncbi:nucleotidyltransferase [Sediminibacillus albus]|uniref:tRNA(Met) cytidine acetate ligase n=1 Tax=Sediminibacillus albus TaxID=407036 RepID=A0A1G8W857_9BACI|nr:nucleotidyltransferase [Sediminibacillus albus]SDJ74514.1 Predicted nucleotidyltransferase [Sediminibacillus albus]
MDACGLIVEYNPFHHGHQYHLEQSRLTSTADCMVAVMSGNFLQRGEPAIIDKFHRAKAAIDAGVDLVLELPAVYAVQNSDLFAKGALLTLQQLKVDYLCFGSELGDISAFQTAYENFSVNKKAYESTLKKHLASGNSYPEASRQAYESIGLTKGLIDLSKPNNILGYSYVKTIYENDLTIKPLTIPRIKNDYHDTDIKHHIASATSIRTELNREGKMTETAQTALSSHMQKIMEEYKQKSGIWHTWENYFSILQYRVLTMSLQELREIHGVDEGLEYRLKTTAPQAGDFTSWMKALKTKRYTWTRLQRIFVHLLINNKKETVASLLESDYVPHLRVLGMNKKGQSYLNQIRKQLNIPLISQLKKKGNPFLAIDERASDAYYSVVDNHSRKDLRLQERVSPYITES